MRGCLLIACLVGCANNGFGDTDPDLVGAVENLAGASGNHWNLVAGDDDSFGQHVAAIAIYPDGTGQLANTGSGVGSQPGTAGYIAPTTMSFGWTRSSSFPDTIILGNLGAYAFIYGQSADGAPVYGTLNELAITSGSITAGAFVADVECTPSFACSEDLTNGTLADGGL